MEHESSEWPHPIPPSQHERLFTRHSLTHTLLQTKLREIDVNLCARYLKALRFIQSVFLFLFIRVVTKRSLNLITQRPNNTGAHVTSFPGLFRNYLKNDLADNDL